ncbi:MAG: hypothetical protein A3F41_06075 [Coxiella sp. RIFCSPHIGHO2_12_FULL_44_14]|nr:MAG: hypothetical protein A3F41_06075 [Coxiella sp. RIFCSPHIGHO2_12_FULL_44_14]
MKELTLGFGKQLFKALGQYLTREVDATKRPFLCDFDRICHEIIPGDVLLIEGNNRISRVIKRITYSHWTHSALYIGRLHSIEDPQTRHIVRKYYHGPAGDQLLIESLIGQGTVIRPITEYKTHHIRICRPVGLSHSDAQKVITAAVHHVGHKYNIRHFIDLGRFLLSSHLLPKRWKSSLFYERPGKASHDICSSMIAEAFTSVNFPILPLVRQSNQKKLEMIHRNPKLFTPSDFDYSPYFAIIKYPIFSFSGRGPYHDLPWREGVVSNDEGNIQPLSEKDPHATPNPSDPDEKKNR